MKKILLVHNRIVVKMVSSRLEKDLGCLVISVCSYKEVIELFDSDSSFLSSC